MEILKHNCLAAAAQIVQKGGVIVYPTDTVWGLGCQALDQTAVAKLKQIKQKPSDAKLIWLLPSVQAVQKFCGPVTPAEKKLLRQKHTTVIIHDQAVRVITHGWLNKLLTACRTPLVSTSANFHGQPVITSWRQAVTLFGDQVDAVVKGRKITKNQPSAVVMVVDGQTKILRPGGRISIR